MCVDRAQVGQHRLVDNFLLGADPGTVDLDVVLRTAMLEADVDCILDGLATRGSAPAECVCPVGKCSA